MTWWGEGCYLAAGRPAPAGGRRLARERSSFGREG
jgi:hypothetical protein